MRMVDIIEKKRDGHALSAEEIDFFIKGYTAGDIPDYQASALAMAIVWRGMDKEEISHLTSAMMHSGDTIDLSKIEGVKVDKHSTGGVGDKTSLALMPLVASYGVKVAKMSGRGLGHTGGTLDKMESIPGLSVSETLEQFTKQVNDIGIAIIGQTKSIDPADKKLYALRDVTGTVQSIPLIASSIMSKKLASGSDTILLDVKFGNGAFMKDIESARELAKTMVDIGESLGRDTRAILTDMNEPLGKAVGNSLEVKEAIDALNGVGPSDFMDLIIQAGAVILNQAKVAPDFAQGRKMMKEAIDSGAGLRKLKELVKAQGGDPSYIDHPEKFAVAGKIIPVLSARSGYVSHIASLDIGLAAMKLGAGRETMDDTIDMSSGIVLNKKVGDYVNEGDVLAYAHTNKDDPSEAIEQIKKAYLISESKPKEKVVVHEYISIL